VDDEFLNDRTFKAYYFDQNAFPDFAIQSQFDFRALQIDEDTLRRVVLKFKDQNFQSVATEWELTNSAILKPGGLTPIVDDEGVVVAYLGDKNPIPTYMRPIMDVHGEKVEEWWDEPPLEPSLPFEVATVLIGGFGTRGLVKGALKATAAAPRIIKLTGGLRGPLLKALLRKRIVPRSLPNLAKDFTFGKHSGTEPNFWGMVVTKDNNVVLRITNQVLHVPKHAPMSPEKIQRLATAEVAAAQERTKAIRFAAEQAKLHGRPTFIMRIEQANQGSREGAEKLLRKLGQPPTAPLETTPIPGAKPFLEYVLEAEKVLANVN